MSKLDDVAVELNNAVDRGNVEAALRLLNDAGGPCKARDLAALTSTKGSIKYSVVENIDTETLTLYYTTFHKALPVAGIVQPRCKR